MAEGSERARPWRRIGWFVALYAAGVAVVFALSLIIRSWLGL